MRIVLCDGCLKKLEGSYAAVPFHGSQRLDLCFETCLQKYEAFLARKDAVAAEKLQELDAAIAALRQGFTEEVIRSGEKSQLETVQHARPFVNTAGR